MPRRCHTLHEHSCQLLWTTVDLINLQTFERLSRMQSEYLSSSMWGRLRLQCRINLNSTSTALPSAILRQDSGDRRVTTSAHDKTRTISQALHSMPSVHTVPQLTNDQPTDHGAKLLPIRTECSLLSVARDILNLS